MESVLSRCIVGGNFIVTVLVKEVLWEMDKNTATWGSFSNLRITVFAYYIRVVTCLIGGAHNSRAPGRRGD
jgi:hypothetical protein